jgi:hypothetical protein
MVPANHLAAAIRTSRVGRRGGRIESSADASRGGRIWYRPNAANHCQHLLAAYQLNGLVLSESFRITREFTNSNDLHRVGSMVMDKPPHFADHRHVDLLSAPLLALHKLSAAVLPQDQIDATVRTA